MEVCDDDDKSSLEEMLNDRPSSADMDEAVLEDVWIKVEHTTKESEQQPSPTQPVTSSQPSAKSSLIVTSEPAVTSSMRKRKQVDAKLIKNGYKSRPTLAQVERLLDMVESKQSILLAPVRTQAARVHNAAVWKEIAARVNYKEGKGEKIGCVKDWRQWNQYWHAKKLSVKMKAHAILQKRLPSEALSDVERRVLALVRGGGGEPGLQNKTVFEDVVEEVVLEDPLSTTPPDPEPTPQETSHTPVTPQVTSNVPAGPKVASQTPKTIKFKPLKFLKIRRPLQNIKVNNKVESEPKPPETSQLPVIPTESLHLPNTPPITSQAPITDLVTSYVPTMPKLTPKPIQLRTPQRFLKIARTFEPVRVVSSPTNNVTTASVIHNGVTQPVTVTTARAEPTPETAGSRLTTITTHPIQRRRLKPIPDLDPNRTQPGQITDKPLPIEDRQIDMEMSSVDIECQSEITLTNDVTEGIVNKASVSEREKPTSEIASSKLASIIRPTIKRRRRPIPDPEPNRTQSQVTDRLLTIEERRIDIEMKSIECQRAAVRAQEEMAKGMQAMAKAVTESFSLLAKAITDVSRTIHQYHKPEVQIKEEKPEPPSDLAPPTTPPRPTVECQICHRTFKAAAHLRRHQSGGPCLAPPPAHTCPTCGQQFQLRNRLTSHLLKHSTDKPHSCPLCPMRFKHKSAVQRHVMLHTDRRPHACDVCGKRFTTGHIMQVHRRSHTQEKPYECPVCHKRFTIRHNMQRHTLNHNKIKHLTCTVCNKEFPKESRLKYHMRVHWADNKPFKCNLCPKSYSHRQNIQRHYGKKHPNVEFMYSETDAAIANKVWERTMGDDDGDETEYIVPEVTIEVKDEVMKPELVMIKEGSSSGETGSDSDDSSDEK